MDAAHWYGQIDEGREGDIRTWFDLAVAWHLMTARALCAGPFEVTGAQLRDPWQCFRDEHIDVLQWLGATATAVVLHRIGRDDLADRFVAWAYQIDTVEAMDMFADVLEAAGLPITRVDEPDNLDALLEQLFAVADELDRSAEVTTRPT
jgi:hypothetical protein